jgi:nickel transport protein
MGLPRTAVFGLVAGVAAALPAGVSTAHDIWITTIGPAEARRAVVNYGHPHDRPPTVADKIIDIFAYTASGRQSLIEGLATVREGDRLVVETKPFRDQGGTLLAVRYDNGYWVKTADGYRNATTREIPDARDSLWSMKFGKALTGPGAPWRQVLGHELEIVPLDDPPTIAPGGTLRLRVLFRGEPLAGGQVERGDGLTPVPEDQIPRFTTDANGVAAIPIVKSGPIQLVIDHTVTPSATPELARKDMFNATLWYEAPSGRKSR